MVSFDMIIDIKFNSILQKLFEKPFPMFLKQILGAWYDLECSWLDGAKDRKGGRKLRKTVIPLNASVLPFKMFRYFYNKL